MLSKPDIIRIAACPRCAAMRGEQCTFSRMEDPDNLRWYAKQSHVERNVLARKKSIDIPPLKL